MPVPSISVHLAPHLPAQPSSPEPDSPRPRRLLPPSPLSPRRHGQLSPLGSLEDSKGLDRERFEAMLRASKERSARLGGKKPIELRKEIALKAQKVKQSERRARFLSKLVAPPSPTAAGMPVTPPDSPAIFHFSLPSPGMVSPLELFEEFAKNPEMYNCKATIEQVDFRLPQQKETVQAARQRRVAAMGIMGTVSTKTLPSLDQISKRLSRSPSPVTVAPLEHGSPTTNRLPSFLRSRTPSQSSTATESSPAVVSSSAPKRPRPMLPSLSLSVPERQNGIAVRTPTPTIAKALVKLPFPPSPKSPRPTNLQITTTICPPTKPKTSPTLFSEANIAEFGTTQVVVSNKIAPPVVAQGQTQRARVSKDLITKLSRRTLGLPGAAACGIRARDDTDPLLSPSGNSEDKVRRRLTAPAEMSSAQRGVRHAVLDKPGGF